ALPISGDDVAVLQYVVDDIKFQYVSIGLQRFGFAEQRPPPVFFGIAVVALELEGSDPQLFHPATELLEFAIVRVRRDPRIQRFAQRLLTDTGRVADPQYTQPFVAQLFCEGVDCGLAGSTPQHLPVRRKRYRDRLDERRCLALAGRTVNNTHIARGEDTVHRVLLTFVESRGRHKPTFGKTRRLQAE